MAADIRTALGKSNRWLAWFKIIGQTMPPTEAPWINIRKRERQYLGLKVYPWNRPKLRHLSLLLDVF